MGVVSHSCWESSSAWWNVSNEIQTLDAWLNKMPVITFMVDTTNNSNS